jgi:4-carboxymuconolactone decarboxylase
MTDWPAPRLGPPDPASLDAEQRAAHDAIAAGPRGGVRGPLAVWLHRPELAQRAQALGAYCRYGTSLPPRLSELAIITVAKVWGSEYEWYAHKPLALEAGIAPEVVEAIRTGAEPLFAKTDEAVVHRFALAAHRDRAVPDGLYREAVDALGEPAVLDLVAICGYYALISLTINVFGVYPPEAAPRELS